MSAEITQTPDFEAVKKKQQVMWTSGDYAVIGTTLQLIGEQLCESMDLHSGHRVLDVACGNGNVSLAAARRFCNVTGLDYVPSLLERAGERARAERLEIRFVQGDAENMPFESGSFDAVVSTVGVMFAPNQPRAAQELTRVCKKGGKIGLACWTPEGMIGELLRTVGKYVPPAPGLVSPVAWGTEKRLAELFGDRARVVQVQRKHFAFRYLSEAHCVDIFRRFYGPTHKAFEALDENGRRGLEADMLALLKRHNRGTGALVAPSEYLETVLEVA